jgi:VanZ family protein
MSHALRRFRFAILALTTVYWMGLLLATHLPPAELPKTHINDKIEHLTAYGLLAAMLHLSLWSSATRRPALVIALIVLATGMAYGAFDELTQPWFQRTCDIRDWYADTVATALACGIGLVLSGYLFPRGHAALADPARE